MKKRFFKTVLFFLVLASMQVKAIENSQKYSLRQCLDFALNNSCLLYTSDAADERSSVDLGGRRIIKKKKKNQTKKIF